MKMSELMNEQDLFTNILMTTDAPKDFKNNYESIKSLNYKGILTPDLLQNAILYSDTPSYTFYCYLKATFKENLLMIIVACSIATFIYL